MHVTDWFPTILRLAKATNAVQSRPLDGVDQLASLFTLAEQSPRQILLYNSYSAVSDLHNTVNISRAIRNERFKLAHAYVGNPTSHWYDIGDADQDDVLDDDTEVAPGWCSQKTASTGKFKMFLYDLSEDPDEETNLYSSAESEHQAAKVSNFHH